jgi:hypothetical protein
MADSLMSYGVAIGVFAFLAAVLFSARAKRTSTSREVASSAGSFHSEAS